MIKLLKNANNLFRSHDVCLSPWNTFNDKALSNFKQYGIDVALEFMAYSFDTSKNWPVNDKELSGRSL